MIKPCKRCGILFRDCGGAKYCKVCGYELELERLRERQRRYRERHREQLRERNREYQRKCRRRRKLKLIREILSAVKEALNRDD